MSQVASSTPPSARSRCNPHFRTSLRESERTSLSYFGASTFPLKPPRKAPCNAAAATGTAGQDGEERDAASSTIAAPSGYSLEQTTALVETAMLAAVSGLVYLIGTLLRFENTIGYVLPLPVVLATFRSGIGAGWKTMMATCFLLVVLLGPLKAVSYLLLHGAVAATLGTLWKLKVGWWASTAISSAVRMAGQLAYLLLSSVTMNENFFHIILNNVFAMLDQVSAAVGASGSPSALAVSCMLFSLLLINSVVYCFLLHVVYRLILQSMGYQLGPLPGFVRKYLYAGMSEEQQRQLEEQQLQRLQEQQQMQQKQRGRGPL